MIIIPLMENEAKEGYFNEKGLSLYIETADKKIIFDMGSSDGYLKNMQKLGISLAEIDYFIISHGHKDHIGGLINILDRIDSRKIYLSRESLSDFSFSFLNIRKNIGLDKEELGIIEEFKINKIDDYFYKIDENITLFRGEKREETIFYNKDGKGDDFSHELQLLITENEKLNIITGCSHLGIENIVSDIRKSFPNKNINSILGGLHTRSYILTPWKIFALIKFLRGININSFYLGHCTGRVVRWILKRTIKNIHNLEIGNRIEV